MCSFAFSYLASDKSTTTKIIGLILVAWFLPTIAFGASLSFSPSAGTYQVGEVFNVNVNVNSAGSALNAISGVISYPADKLEVVSLSKNQSIFSLWVQEPSYSNSAGTINFEGVVLNPGFIGASGRVLNIAFKAKSTGQAEINFTAGSVLANDGEGSEILTSRGRAEISIIPPAPVIEEVPAEEVDFESESKSDLTPIVVSATHPVDAWSKETIGSFNFSWGSEVVSMRLLLDEEPDSVPVIVYTPPILQREIKDLPVGVSYLHVQYKDKDGWGEILHYKIQIDTQVPDSFIIKEAAPGLFLFEAKDSHSGIARYEVQIDGGEVMEFVDDGSHLYKAAEQTPGQHILTARAYDWAGNYTTTTFPFMIPAKVNELPVVATPPEVKAEAGLWILQGDIIIKALSIVIPTIALIFLLCFMLYSAWRFIGGLRQRINKEVKEANLIVHKAFMILKTDLEVDIETLRKANLKRKLTREEAKILKRLQANLTEAELAINKEIADIDKEINS